MRLFIALHLDTELRQALAQVQGGLRAADRRHQVRWVDVAGLHLTLKFLGEVAEERAEGLVQELSACPGDRMAPVLALGHLGGFPNLARARVLWIGLEENGHVLWGLRACIEDAAAKLGFAREDRPFQAHVTLGRVREGPGRRPDALDPELRRVLQATPIPAVKHRPLSRLALVRSHLTPRGSRYQDVQSWDLEIPRA